MLRPDVLEFQLHHAGGDREVVALGQLVEQGPLQPQSRGRRVIALHLLLHLRSQLGEAFEADGLAQLVVDHGRQKLPDLLHIDLEDRFLAGEVLGRVILGKGDPHGAVLPGRGADQLLLETGDQTALAECDLAVFAAGAGDLLVAGPSFKVDDQDVAGRGRAVRRLRLALLFGDPRDRRVDAVLRHLDDEPFDAEAGEIRLGDLGQDFDQHLVFEVGPLAERHDVNLGRQRRPQIMIADRVGRAALDRALQHLAQDRGAIAPAQDLHRDLAGAEPGQANGAAELVEPSHHLVFELARRDHDAVLALEPVGAGFRHLHQTRPALPASSPGLARRSDQDGTVIGIASQSNN